MPCNVTHYSLPPVITISANPTMTCHRNQHNAVGAPRRCLQQLLLSRAGWWAAMAHSWEKQLLKLVWRWGFMVMGRKHTISKMSGRNVNFLFFSIEEKDRKGKRYPSKVTLPNCRSKPSYQGEDSAWKLCIAKRVAKRHRHVETDNLTLQSQWFLLEWFPKDGYKIHPGLGIDKLG